MTTTAELTPADLAAILTAARRPDGAERLGRRIAVMNNKGGVGKTTLTVEIGLALAELGWRVLLVDGDPQANLTGRTRATPNGTTLTDVLAFPVEKGGARRAIVPCGWEGVPEAALIDVLPSDMDLEARAEEAAQVGAVRRLYRALHEVADEYDFVLIDCRPSLGHLEQMAFNALGAPGDGVLLVVEPQKDAIAGAYRVKVVLDEWADRMEIDAGVLGVIVNRHVGRYSLHRERVAYLGESLALAWAEADDDTDAEQLPADAARVPVMRPYIPQAVRLTELHDLGEPSTADRRLAREGVRGKIAALAAGLVTTGAAQ